MDLLQDLRFAVRLLVKDKWFTLVAAVALAVGIGVNNTVFAVVNAILIRGLPFKEPDRIMALSSRDKSHGRDMSVSYLDFNDWRDERDDVRADEFDVGRVVDGQPIGELHQRSGGACLRRVDGSSDVVDRRG